jgi:LemA protein
MNNFWTMIWGGVVLLLLASGLFDFIDWKFNIIAIAIVVAIWVISLYNGFVRLVNRTKEAWADIDVQLKRRYDLIPNLVNTVKGYAAHESKTFEKVTEARTKAMQASGAKEKGQAENMLTDALKSIFAVAEAYPDLKANQNFLELQRELSDTENKIQAARRFYNTNVRDLNTGLESFPGNIIGNAFKFEKQEFFELAEGEGAAREPVEVKF